jgi:G-patch domain/R3H domain
MDNHARKVIHELANKLKLKSKSTGAGDERRPILFRTAASLKYSEQTFEVAVDRINRKYFSRTDIKKRAKVRVANTAATATHVREGDIVGQGAPVLGEENRGRAMLEKMGWTMGMGLGAAQRQGLLEPVTQVVRHSKAGLG